jgi:hypothetical protein
MREDNQATFFQRLATASNFEGQKRITTCCNDVIRICLAARKSSILFVVFPLYGKDESVIVKVEQGGVWDNHHVNILP